MKNANLPTSIFLAIVLHLVLAASSHSQNDDFALQVLKEHLEGEKKKLADPLVKFQARYAEQLEGLKKKAQDSGDLEQVLAITNEIKMIPSGGSKVPANFGDLVKLQKVYDAHIAKLDEKRVADLRRIMRAHRAKLSGLQSSLTRDGKIEEAVAVKREIAAIDAALESGMEYSPGSSGAANGNTSPGRLVIFGTYSDGSPATLSEKQQEGSFTRVATGYDHWMALTDDGKVSTRTGSKSYFNPESGTRKIVELQCGRHLQLVIKEDGTLIPLSSGDSTKAIPEVDKDQIAKVSLGHSKHAFLLKDGTMMPFGYSFFHENITFPREDLMKDVADVSVGGHKIAVVKKDGSAHLVSIKGEDSSNRPEGLKDIVAVESGLSTGAYFLTKRGKVIAWGVTSPPDNLKRAVQIRVGTGCAAAQMEDGTWVLWGSPEGVAAPMNAKLKELGPLKDLAIGTRYFIGIK